MARDVPRDKAVVILEGVNSRGKKIVRYLDGPPSLKDMRGLVRTNIQLLQVITRAAVDRNLYPGDAE